MVKTKFSLNQQLVGLTLILLVLIGVAFKLFYKYIVTAPEPEIVYKDYLADYSTLEIDKSDGSINTFLDRLSAQDAARLPNVFFKYYIFGERPQIIDVKKGAIPPFDKPDMATVTFSVKDSPEDLLLKYDEYFIATHAGFLKLPEQGVNGFYVLKGSYYIYVKINNYNNGSSVQLSLIPVYK